MTTFRELGLAEPLLRALSAEGYEVPTPVQELAIPPLIEGRDVLGVAQTGTGKTAAFALPVLQALLPKNQSGKRRIRALVLSPTRELAAQIGDRFAAYADELDVRHFVIFGGVNQNPQVRALRRGVDVLVATLGGFSIWSGKATSTCLMLIFSSSMKPIGCSIWASSMIFVRC